MVGLHGYRPTGSRVLIYDVDEKGFPKISRRRCAISQLRPQPTRAFQTDGAEVAAAPYDELVSGWYKVNGVRPQGAPVGMTVASDGAIWLVEDKNKSVIRIDTASDGAADPLPCNQRSAAADRRTRKIRRGRCAEQHAADADPERTGREALRQLPLRFRAEGGPAGRREGSGRAAVHAVAGRLDLSRRSGVWPAAHAPAWHRRRKADAARWREAPQDEPGYASFSIRSTISSARWCPARGCA